MTHPDWALKYKTKGTELRKFGDKYYLYKVSSRWDKDKKRSQKVTGEYLGVITKDGLLPPKHKRASKMNLSEVSVKEYGACKLLTDISQDLQEKLEEIFPDDCNMIYALSILKAIHKSPFKRIDHYYQHSFLSTLLGSINMSGKSISIFLRELGQRRDKIVSFLNHFISGSQHILFDVTSIFSQSKKMDINRLGYNRHKIYDPQINLLYAFASDTHSPVYYRILPGNIRDITAFKLSILEAGLKNAVVIADKGFGSKENLELMDKEELQYIIPLKRNNILIDDQIIRSGDRKNYHGHFMFMGRPIWYYSYKVDGLKKVVVYVDEYLRAEEEKDYLVRIENNIEGFNMDNFFDLQYRFGTLAVIENCGNSPKEIFELYKSRDQIEKSFDMLKSTLEADSSYMQDERALEAWAFINHISLIMLYKIYQILKKHKMISKYSITDLIEHVKYIFKIKINNEWVTSEISKKTIKLLNSLEINIT